MDFAKLLSQIGNMVFRRLLNKGVNAGVNKGMEMMARKGKPGTASPQAQANLSTDARAAAKRARQAAQLARRLGR